MPRNHPSVPGPKELGPGRGLFPGTRLGWIDHLEAEVPWVDFEGNPGAPIPARSLLVGLAALQSAASTRQQVVLVFGGGSQPPELLSLVQPRLAPCKSRGSTSHLLGQRVVISATEQLELRCGGARISFDSLETVHIEGERLETRATGVNALRGDEIDIN